MLDKTGVILLQTQLQSPMPQFKQLLTLSISNVFSANFNGPYKAVQGLNNYLIAHQKD